MGPISASNHVRESGIENTRLESMKKWGLVWTLLFLRILYKMFYVRFHQTLQKTVNYIIGRNIKSIKSKSVFLSNLSKTQHSRNLHLNTITIKQIISKRRLLKKTILTHFEFSFVRRHESHYASLCYPSFYGTK